MSWSHKPPPIQNPHSELWFFISLCFYLLFLPLHHYLLHNSNTHWLTQPSRLPSVWTLMAPGNEQRRVCVQGGRHGVSLSKGDNVSAGSTQSQAPSFFPFVCPSLIIYLQITFTKATISILCPTTEPKAYTEWRFSFLGTANWITGWVLAFEKHLRNHNLSLDGLFLKCTMHYDEVVSQWANNLLPAGGTDDI